MKSNCNQCGAQINGKPGSVSTKSSGGWCGSRRVTRTIVVCQDCIAAGEYQQHLYRQQLQEKLLASLTPDERARMMARLEAKS